ncbi:MAG: PAS domain S-box protein [Burkholderiales bacterium]|nr:PAS domain S-box protein [Burkholderiales bacterium]
MPPTGEASKPELGRLRKLVARFALLVVLSALPFAVMVGVLAGLSGAAEALERQWPMIAAAFGLAAGGVALLFRNLRARVAELHQAALALTQGQVAHRLPDAPGGSAVPGLRDQFNRMAERLEAQGRQLETALARARSLIDDAPEAIMVADYATGCFVDVNEAAARLLGSDRASLIGRSVFDVVRMPGLDAAAIRERVTAIARRVLGGENVVMIVRIVTGEGREMPVESRWMRLPGDGRLLRASLIDASDRETAEASMRESEQRFRQLTRLSSDWYWEQDAEFRFVRTDTDAYRGDKPLGESVGMTRWERPGTRPVGITWEQHRRDLEAHRPFAHLILELTLPDRRRSYVAVRGEPVFDAHGVFCGYRGVGADISQRYRADLLRAGERHVYEKLAAGATLEQLMDALCESIEGALTMPGRASLLMLDGGVLRVVSAPSMGTSAYREMLAAGVAPGPEAGACGTAVHRNQPVVCTDLESDPLWAAYRDVARACGFASAWSTPISGESGMPIATFAVYRDFKGRPVEEDIEITRSAAALAGVLIERFRAASAQRELDSRYRSLVELAEDGVVLHQQGTIEYANPGMARILRLSDPASLAGTDLFERLAPASLELMRRRLRRVLEKGEPVGYVELRMRADDGEYVDVEAASGPVEIGGRRMAQTYVRDIGERKWAEREMQRLNNALELKVAERTAELSAANAELESFSYTVAHDLRAPVRAIDGFARLLRHEAAEHLPSSAQRDVEQILASTARMAELIDGLLAFSRLSRGVPSYGRIAMMALVQGVIADVAAQYAHRPEVVVEPLPDVFGDAGMLRQVWFNLIANAFKFTARAAAPLIRVTATAAAGEVVFAVSDNGAGFDQTYAGKLFGIFQRLHGRAEFEGTGIGLAIVKRVVERHHGWVRATGAPGQGAVFSFALPATSVVLGEASGTDPAAQAGADMAHGAAGTTRVE